MLINCSGLCNFQVRDYIHVVDLADGHIAALNKVSDPSVGMSSKRTSHYCFMC